MADCFFCCSWQHQKLFLWFTWPLFTWKCPLPIYCTKTSSQQLVSSCFLSQMIYYLIVVRICVNINLEPFYLLLYSSPYSWEILVSWLNLYVLLWSARCPKTSVTSGLRLTRVLSKVNWGLFIYVVNGFSTLDDIICDGCNCNWLPSMISFL